mmetsp:Transcript_133631/g.260217  ORF Transcript_133631/g.260217 Transcript_133631/m.260217 type:complete len:217 (-) Transcript_133631:45-695(-)
MASAAAAPKPRSTTSKTSPTRKHSPRVGVEGKEGREGRERHAPVQCDVHKDAVVCHEAKIMGVGGIKIGQGTAVHPACTINAKVGPIVIGRFNIIEEQVEITNTSEEPLVIGDYNIFEVGAKVVGNSTIGDANLFECRSQLGPNAKVGDGCTFSVGAMVPPGEQLPDEIVVVGPPGLRHVEIGAKDAHIQAASKHIEVLKETLPRCHHLRRGAKSS